MEQKKGSDSAKSEEIINKRIHAYEQAKTDADNAIELYDTFSSFYQNTIEELNLFDSNGNLRDRQSAHENIEADSWTEIEEYGRIKLKWLSDFLDLPNGIPSHDTFGRVFSLLSPEKFQKCFLSWIQSVSSIADGQVVAIDGKTLRHSYDRSDNKSAIHMVIVFGSKYFSNVKNRRLNRNTNSLRSLKIFGTNPMVDSE